MKISFESRKYFTLMLLVSIILSQAAIAEVIIGSNACLSQIERKERDIGLAKIL